MATYKVIQDIEAEDKLVGPLSLKQFIYACIAAICGYLSFISITKGAAFLLVIFAPIMLFMGFFAFPWGRDQPTEVWALAKIRYFLKPRRRIWDQSGVKELVNITVPKRIERILTNSLTETQVQGRLTALASTLDSRGWAVKNVNLNLEPENIRTNILDSDRLIEAAAMPQEVSSTDITAGDDMLDEINNPRAQQLEQLMSTSTRTHRARLIEEMQQPSQAPQQIVAPQNNKSGIPQLPTPADYWYLNKPLDIPASFSPLQSTIFSTTPTNPVGDTSTMQPSLPQPADPTPDEEALAEELRRQREKTQQTVNFQHMKVIQPLGSLPPQQPSGATATPSTPPANLTPASPVTPPTNPATMRLAARDDLTIATIANIANKQDEEPDEVVITLRKHSS